MPAPTVKDVAQMKTHFVVATGQSAGISAKEKAKADMIRLLKSIDDVIKTKWNALNGAPGQPITPDFNGLKVLGKGYYREYTNGTIYYLPPAIGPFWVSGAILDRYKALRGPEGDLGWPTGDAQDGTEGGKIQTFSTHTMYWWPDTGAIEMTGSIVVTYTGLACFGETDDDQSLSFSTEDEPYVVLGTYPPMLPPLTIRTIIYEDVDGGETREQQRIELHRGLPIHLPVVSVVMEHDLEDPDKYKESIRVGVEKASEAVGKGMHAIPYVGPYLGPLAEALLKAIGPDIAEGLNEAFDFGDDHIGTGTFTITTKQMVMLSRAPKNNHKGIIWDLDSPLISGDGASYKIYVAITNE